MPRKKRALVEIVPASEAALVPAAPTANLQAAIESMVRKRVDEILSVELEADFRPTNVARVARQTDDLFERRKWALYFEKWGCRICGKKNVAYGSTGHCQTCALRIAQRLRQIKLEFNRAHPDLEIERNIDQLTSASRTARELLR